MEQQHQYTDEFRNVIKKAESLDVWDATELIELGAAHGSNERAILKKIARYALSARYYDEAKYQAFLASYVTFLAKDI